MTRNLPGTKADFEQLAQTLSRLGLPPSDLPDPSLAKALKLTKAQIETLGGEAAATAYLADLRRRKAEWNAITSPPVARIRHLGESQPLCGQGSLGGEGKTCHNCFVKQTSQRRRTHDAKVRESVKAEAEARGLEAARLLSVQKAEQARAKVVSERVARVSAPVYRHTLTEVELGTRVSEAFQEEWRREAHRRSEKKRRANKVKGWLIALAIVVAWWGGMALFAESNPPSRTETVIPNGRVIPYDGPTFGNGGSVGGDYDCAGGSGNGPNYVDGPIHVGSSDPYGLDADGDGIGCEG